MSDHFDRLENRTPAARESALFRDLRHILSVAKARVPALRAQIKGIDIATILTRADLARIPVLRQADLMSLQAETPLLGGLVATRVPLLRQLFVDKNAVIAIEGQAKDWWGAGRALFAAGLRKGALVINCFSYDLVHDAHVIESGADVIGAPLIPAGGADVDRKIDVIERFRPVFFCGTGDHLRLLLDRGLDRKADVKSITHALVTGPMSAGLRSEFSLRGIAVRQMTIHAALGVTAYECGPTEGMTINEGLIVEIVDPVTMKPVPVGTEGEIVVTRLNADYPLLRFATGTFSTVLLQPSACGRTNLRIAVPRSKASDHRCGIHVTPAHLDEIKKMHPLLGRMRLYMRRPREHDVLHLKAEHASNSEALEQVSKTLHQVTRIRGTVEFVEPGSLKDDEAAIIDERPLN